VTFLKESTVSKLNLRNDKLDNPITIEFANGQSTVATAAAQLNDSLSALILPDSSLIEDLISINPIVDAGYDVHMSRQGGSIIKDGRSVIPITRSGQKIYY